MEQKRAAPGRDFSPVFRLVLMIGLAASFASMGLGLALTALGAGGAAFIPLGGLAAALARGEAAAFLNLGLLLLMCTPLARVAASLVAFCAAREWAFAAVTAAVFLLLVLNLLLGVG